jgi:hypothetical protein
MKAENAPPSTFGRTFALDFVGRRSLFKGNYGHLGASDYFVVVDRIISIRDITPSVVGAPSGPHEKGGRGRVPGRLGQRSRSR